MDPFDGWQTFIRLSSQEKMGQLMISGEEKQMSVQPLKIPLGDPGQPGPAELDGRMDAYATWKDPGMEKGKPLT